MKRFFIIVFLIGIIGGSSLVTYAKERQNKAEILPTIFSDNMMFQQNKPMTVWGYGNVGEAATAKLYANDSLLETCTAMVDENGKWELAFQAREGGCTSYVIEITCGRLQKKIQDVLVGELWLASGQSNMELMVSADMDVDELLKNATNPNVRIFLQPTLPQGANGASLDPYDDIPGAYWICGNYTALVGNASSIAYNFALNLQEELNVPVGIIDASRGATFIEQWLPRTGIEKDTLVKEKLKAYGLYRDETAPPSDYQGMSVLYNQKIGPLKGISVAGVIWYQGEANGIRSELYGLEIDLLKRSWGETFGFPEGDMPLIFTQVAPYRYDVDRSAQQHLGYLAMYMEQGWRMSEDKNTAMLTIYDLPLDHMKDGLSTDPIHPRRKVPVAKRFAQAAINMVYGGEEEYTAPVFESIQRKGQYIEITFSHVGVGLKSTDGSKNFHGFAIAGKDGIYVDAKAELMDKDTVRVWNDGLKEPQNVTYAFNNFNQGANLCNSAGIPASPFRTAEINDTASNPDLNTTYFTAQDWMHADKDVWVFDATFSQEWNYGYRPSYVVSDAAQYSYDNTIFAEGTASLKMDYSGSFTFSPILTYGGIKQSWKNFKYLTMQIYNPSETPITLSLKVDVGGNEYFIPVDGEESIQIPQGQEFEQVVFDLSELSPLQRDALLKVTFVIETVGGGTIYVDDFSFALTNPNHVKEEILDTESNEEHIKDTQKGISKYVPIFIATPVVLILGVLGVLFCRYRRKKNVSGTEFAEIKESE